jgi:hypothetical protein
MKCLHLSPELIPWREYDRGELAKAAVPAAVLSLSIQALKASIMEVPYEGSEIPRNAILFGFHCDSVAALLSDVFFRDLGHAWLGYHGFASYVGSLTPMIRKRPCIRFQRKRSPSDHSPMQYILSQSRVLEGRPFYLLTDSGGPYGQVRPSLVRLAMAMERPLVAIRHFVSKQILIKEHVIPMPGCRLETVTGSPISYEELKRLALQDDRATQLLQRSIASLKARW